MASTSTAASVAMPHHDHTYSTVVRIDADDPLMTAAGDEENVIDDKDETIGRDDITIGVAKASIVGIRVRSNAITMGSASSEDWRQLIELFFQYYAGVVSNGERVSLVREPRNPHDPNAIRVDNCVGEQIGHIRRQQAAALTPLIDGGEEVVVLSTLCFQRLTSSDLIFAGRIRVDATVVRGSENKFSIPAMVVVYGPADDVEKITDELKMRGVPLLNVPKTRYGPNRPAADMEGNGRG